MFANDVGGGRPAVPENVRELIGELYDACDALLSIVESLDDGFDYAAVEMARAAMDKAEAVQ
jgi:hypothetical protein